MQGRLAELANLDKRYRAGIASPSRQGVPTRQVRGVNSTPLPMPLNQMQKPSGSFWQTAGRVGQCGCAAAVRDAQQTTSTNITAALRRNLRAAYCT